MEKYDTLKKQWGKLYEIGENSSLFFKARGFRNIAIYGVGKFAECLISDLASSDFKINIFHILNQSFEIPLAVDIVVILDIENYMFIEHEICKKYFIEVISIQELIDKTLRNAKRK